MLIRPGRTAIANSWEAALGSYKVRPPWWCQAAERAGVAADPATLMMREFLPAYMSLDNARSHHERKNHRAHLVDDSGLRVAPGGIVPRVPAIRRGTDRDAAPARSH